jgi:DNA-binding response OmpR family regulator
MDEIKVAVMNTSKEITQMLTEVLQEEGFTTSSIFTYHFKDHEKEFDKYVQENKPEVILYDIAIPYKENYFLFKKLISRDSVKNIPFVLTTTNKEALEGFVGETETHELVGKPYDLQEIIDAINTAYRKSFKKSPLNHEVSV